MSEPVPPGGDVRRMRNVGGYSTVGFRAVPPMGRKPAPEAELDQADLDTETLELTDTLLARADEVLAQADEILERAEEAPGPERETVPQEATADAAATVDELAGVSR
ncbi:MAG: hypothetical protein J2P18_14790 [Nocardia sp.]|nr:hypothetical protein [Nocardia sp.]